VWKVRHGNEVGSPCPKLAWAVAAAAAAASDMLKKRRKRICQQL